MFNGAGPTKAIFSKMTMIDVGLGMGMVMAGRIYDEDKRIILKNNMFYGASPSPDCP